MTGSGGARLWHNRAFLMLWVGQTVSLLGSQVTALALPLTAVLVLRADAAQLGLLGALQTAPFLPAGLAAGVLADRVRRRPVLVAADTARAFLLASIPLAWSLGALHLPQLYVVALLAGTLRMFFNVAYSAYLPSLVARERLVEGNSKLGLSASVAEVAGPGLAGALVALATAPVAIVVDAASFLVSALSLGLIRTPEAPPRAPDERAGVWRELREGLAVIWRHVSLRAITGYSLLMNLFFQAIHAIFVLYVTRDLGLSPALFGVILMASSVGSLLGALLVPVLTRLIGPGPALLAGAGCYGVGALAIPLATRPPLQALGVLLPAWGLIGVGNGLSNIVSVSLKQLMIPDRLLGRASASGMAVGWGAAPLGALLGGALGQGLGLRAALLLAALGTLSGVLWLACSPLRTLREPPQLIA
jgi:Na+/melibiose symporter-like transporter